jgi:hypothetical protein
MVVKLESASNHRPPGFQQQNQKIQVLHLVSIRSQEAILSLPQLYRICTELPEHTVLCRFHLLFPVLFLFAPPFRSLSSSAGC